MQIEDCRQTVARARTYYDALFRWLRRVVWKAMDARGTPPPVSVADLELVAQTLAPAPAFTGDFLIPMSVTRRFFKHSAPTGAGAGAGSAVGASAAGAGAGAGAARGSASVGPPPSLVDLLARFHDSWRAIVVQPCTELSPALEASAAAQFIAASYDAFADEAVGAADVAARVDLCYVPQLAAGARRPRESLVVAAAVETMMDEDGDHSNMVLIKQDSR